MWKRQQHVGVFFGSFVGIGFRTFISSLFYLIFIFFARVFYWSHPFGRQGCRSGRGDVFRPAKHYRLFSRVPGIRPAPPAPRSAGEVSSFSFVTELGSFTGLALELAIISGASY